MKSAVLYSIAVLLAVAVFVVFQRSRKQDAQKQFKTTDELIQSLAAGTVSDARRENNVNLDYSVDSIKEVERIFGKIHDDYAQNPSSVSVNGLAWS